MPTKSGDPKGKGAAFRNSVRPQAKFVQYELTKQEQADVKAVVVPHEELFDFLMGLVEKDYKVTFKWDSYHNCNCCWLIPSENDTDNRGLILTGRGSSPEKAIKQAMWLHTVRFKSIWPVPGDRASIEIDD